MLNFNFMNGTVSKKLFSAFLILILITQTIGGVLFLSEKTFAYPAYQANSDLIKFQEAHSAEILTPFGLKKGTGIFGSGTRGL